MLLFITCFAGIPDAEDRLILLLGLGSTGQDYSSTGGGGGDGNQVTTNLHVLQNQVSNTENVAIASVSVSSNSFPTVQLHTTSLQQSQPPAPTCETNRRVCHDYIESRGELLELSVVIFF